jgi:cyclophilin family peptidyl-prolyl cis-trans isomerase/protein-disulfide isomerase
MLKKVLFILMIGVLLLSACKAATPEPTATPMDITPTETVEEVDDPAEQDGATETVIIGEGDRMPCSTVYEYETTEETDQYQAVADQLPPVSEDDWIRGNPDAPITIVEYADFQCPACGNFALYLEALMETFPTSIRVVFRHMPLVSIHDKAFISSMAAEAAGAQGKFWELYDLMYQNQQEWSGFNEEEFVEWALSQAEALELDLDQFEADLNDEEARTQLEETTNEQLSLGLHYTPFVVINDRIFRENKPDLFALIGIHEYGGYEQCPSWVIDPEGSYTARLDISAGEILIDLFPGQAPLAVNSFVFLAQNGWYDDVYFHRVVEGFVAQAGDPSGFGVVGPGYTFANETNNDLSYDSAGILGMANAGVDTNGSQFFITLASATDLNGGYTIFGEVQEDSMAVLNEIVIRDPQTAVGFDDATIINTIEIIEN